MQSTLKLAALALATLSASAAVTDSSPTGFTSKVVLDIKAPPEDVYRKFVHNIGDWWDGAHTFSKDPHNLSIDERPGGCFCEKLPNGGGVRHMEIVYIGPGQAIVLSGGLGPLQSLAATGTLTISFQKGDAGTKLDVTYAVSGYLPQGMNTWAAPVDGVITAQFTRLKNYAERGSPQPPPNQ